MPCDPTVSTASSRSLGRLQTAELGTRPVTKTGELAKGMLVQKGGDEADQVPCSISVHLLPPAPTDFFATRECQARETRSSLVSSVIPRNKNFNVNLSQYLIPNMN